MAAKVLYKKTRSGYDEEFKNRSLRSFVVVNKAKQGKAQVTLCFKCETSGSSKTRNVVEKATPVSFEGILCDGPGRFPSRELYILVGRWDTPFSEPQACP